jgi:hypothetical protein
MSHERRRAVWNIIIGIVFIVGGLSGRFVLVGTESGKALAVIGAGFLVWGLVQLARRRGK